jgi:hypothetical protein
MASVTKPLEEIMKIHARRRGASAEATGDPGPARRRLRAIESELDV